MKFLIVESSPLLILIPLGPKLFKYYFLKLMYSIKVRLITVQTRIKNIIQKTSKKGTKKAKMNYRLGNRLCLNVENKLNTRSWSRK